MRRTQTGPLPAEACRQQTPNARLAPPIRAPRLVPLGWRRSQPQRIIIAVPSRVIPARQSCNQRVRDHETGAGGNRGTQDKHLPPRRASSHALLRSPLASVCACILGIACAHQKQTPPVSETWTYTVSDRRENRALWQVELCFRGERPQVLVATEEAAEIIIEPRDSANSELLPLERGTTPTIHLRDLEGSCLTYGVDLSAASQGFRSNVRRVGDDLVVANELWLWHPRRIRPTTQITAEFHVGKARISTPWTSNNQGRFVLPKSALYWRSYTAIGDLDIDTIEVAGGSLEIVLLDAPHRLTRAGAHRWLRAAGEATAALYGTLPVPHLRVLVLPIGASYEPVIFGTVERGGASVLLLINSEADDEDFYGEWVAIHEFLHLGMPFIDRDDAWLPEGFVTYYTEVVRARMGMKSEVAAWSALLDGFRRGREDVRRDRSLDMASRSMHRLHAYSWVYWGGAAIALLSDVTIRQQSGGKLALDDGLRHIWRCCALSHRRWTGAEILAELDRWRGDGWLIPLSQRLLRTSGFDELPSLYRKLGVSMVHESPALDGISDLSHLRSEIFAKSSQASN